MEAPLLDAGSVAASLVASALPAARAVKADPGFYAWWAQEGALAQAMPHIDRVQPHGSQPGWALLYIGIAPASPSSGGNLRKRVVGDHGGDAIARSTFRYSLASLLYQRLGLRVIGWAGSERKPKPVLDDETALTQWIETHCCANTVTCANPWGREAELIERLGPPLNWTHGVHPFRHQVKKARGLLLAEAKRLRDQPGSLRA